MFETGTVKREDVFITTKIPSSEFENVEATLRASLAKLKLEYVDLYLVHAVTPFLTEDPETKAITVKRTPFYKTWAAMENLVRLGLVRSIGLSNATTPVVLDVLTYCEIKPVTNQIEIHPYLSQPDVVEFHKRVDILLTAYSPIAAPAFGKTNLLDEPVLKEIADRNSKTPA